MTPEKPQRNFGGPLPRRGHNSTRRPPKRKKTKSEVEGGSGECLSTDGTHTNTARTLTQSTHAQTFICGQAVLTSSCGGPR